MPDLRIQIVSYSQGLMPIQRIRQKVFQEEQGVSAELEFDGKDETAQHLLAYLDKIAVGTLRIRRLDSESAKIERLAVLPEARGKGIGKALMKQALREIEEQGFHQAVLNAQVYIQPLYETLGFEVVGDRFQEAGILHVKMVKTLVRNKE
ncbi:MAG: GNAT family N-acetyltransferase [Chroococcales cyanobacterium]